MGDTVDSIPVEERDRLQKELKEQEKLLDGYQRVGSFISCPVLHLTSPTKKASCVVNVFPVILHVYCLSDTST